MKKGILSFNRLMWSMLFVGSMLFNVSCNDKFKEEIDALKASNAELQSQLDLDGSTITELEAQKATLEAQKSEADADITALNEMIAKLEGMIASRYVERYLSTIIGTENHNTYQWQHLYNEDMQLASSRYTHLYGANYDYQDLLGGETSVAANTSFTHNYVDGVLISSESDEMELVWTYANGSIVEIRGERTDRVGEYVLYAISEETGNIISSESQGPNKSLDRNTYFYNENNLVEKIERIEGGGNFRVEVYAYDDQSNLISYSNTQNGTIIIARRWALNAEGNITKYINKEYSRNDSLVINYNNDGSREVNFEQYYDYDVNGYNKNVYIRHYNSDNLLTYWYEKTGQTMLMSYANEYEGLVKTKRINYFYAQGNQIGWYLRAEEHTSFGYDNSGNVTDKEFNNTYFLESGEVSYVTLFAYKDMVTSSKTGTMLSYTYENYNAATGELNSKREYINRELEDGRYFRIKVTEYVVESGIAIYVGLTEEVTEFFTEAPLGPKVKVEKTFDVNGETSSTSYVNDVNSTSSWDWNWVMQ